MIRASPSEIPGISCEFMQIPLKFDQNGLGRETATATARTTHLATLTLLQLAHSVSFNSAGGNPKKDALSKTCCFPSTSTLLNSRSEHRTIASTRPGLESKESQLDQRKYEGGKRNSSTMSEREPFPLPPPRRTASATPSAAGQRTPTNTATTGLWEKTKTSSTSAWNGLYKVADKAGAWSNSMVGKVRPFRRNPVQLTNR